MKNYCLLCLFLFGSTVGYGAAIPSKKLAVKGTKTGHYFILE
jgi:hypothetical protein